MQSPYQNLHSITMSGQYKYTNKKESFLTRVIGYEWLLKNLPFFLFLAALAVVYIYNGHWADKTIRNINVTARELKDLQYEYKTLKSEEMFRSREVQIVQAATPLGLKLSDEPPSRIMTDSVVKK